MFVTQTTDENQHPVKEYKDKEEHVVLKSVYDGSNWLNTYYVYDDFGLLRYVLPPKLMANIGSTTSLSQNSDIVKQLGYYYQYDSLNRMIVKQLPGAGPVYMVYDKRDRLVLSQDGKMRAENPSQWIFTKYDALNRPVLTGEYTHTSALGQADMQAVVYNFYANSPGAKYFEEAGSNVHGYTNLSFPCLSDENAYLTVTYYDDYSTVNTWGSSYSYIINFSISPMTTVKGQVTGTKIKVLNTTNTWLYTALYYDDKYRIIQIRHDLYDGSNGGKETISSLYDFVGKVLQTKQIQSFNGTTTTVDKWMTYDHAGRLVKTEQEINGANHTVTSQIVYNELGQLQKKTLGSVQDENYQYNIRGWLTQINDPDNLGSNMFGMKLLYNDANTSLGNQTQFNGNISGMLWKSSTKAEQGYSFGYDPLNRLTGSDYKINSAGAWTESTAFEEKSIGYDANGNITTLLRTNDTGSTRDSFAYHYNGNQLTDISNGMAYTYDANGNMKKDGLRNFDVMYNILNLPSSISKGSDNISYIYSAAGEKLAKKMKDNTYQYYAGNFVYGTDKGLDYILFKEGKVNRQADGSLVYDYFIKDHLGNTRVDFSQRGTNVRETEYYPFGSN
ncbi:MAG: hypothetical protein Q8904_15015 [Bacteroidota bacterium]|nr:hypothetical protein [Bacteroidota bacterium]